MKRVGTDMFIFEETLFTKTINRLPFFYRDRTLMDKYVPADDLQREQEERTNSDDFRTSDDRKAISE